MSKHTAPTDGAPSAPVSVAETPQQHQATQPTPNQATPTLFYDSNPFTISIRGFQLLMKFAQSIVITILVLALFSFAFQTISQIVSSFTGSSASAQQDDVSETLDSINNELQLDSANRSAQDGLANLADDSSSIDGQATAAIGLIVVGVVGIILLISLPITVAFSAAFKGFVAAGTIAAIQNRHIAFGEALSAMANRFGTLFVAELIATLKIIGGFVLFIVPGIRAQLRYEALPYLIMNDNTLGAKAALAQTKELYTKHLMEVFGIRFFAGLIPGVGAAFAAGGIGLSMQQLQAYKQAKLATPKTHWLNYLGLMLMGGFLVLIAAPIVFLLVFLASQ
jgi:hypothetical protein